VGGVLDYTLVLDENSNIRALLSNPLHFIGEFNMTQRITSSALAAAAALIAMSSAFAADAPAGSMGSAVAASDKVHCYGVHSCKGNSDCKTSENACKGQNACKGHGFKALDAKACLSKGGTIGDLGAAK
jgi:uncharacterized membrane protein